jgi:hypothetical protein
VGTISCLQTLYSFQESFLFHFPFLFFCFPFLLVSRTLCLETRRHGHYLHILSAASDRLLMGILFGFKEFLYLGFQVVYLRLKTYLFFCKLLDFNICDLCFLIESRIAGLLPRERCQKIIVFTPQRLESESLRANLVLEVLYVGIMGSQGRSRR